MNPLNSSVCSPASSRRPWAARHQWRRGSHLPRPEAAVGPQAERVVGPIGVHALARQPLGAGEQPIDLGDKSIGRFRQGSKRRAVVRRQQVGQHTAITTLIVGGLPQMAPRPLGQHRAIAPVVAPDPTIELHADLAAHAVPHRAELQRHRRPQARQHRKRHRCDDRRRVDHLTGRQRDCAGVGVDRLHDRRWPHPLTQPLGETRGQLIVAADDAVALATTRRLQPGEPAGNALTDLLGRQHVLRSNLTADHQTRQHRQIEGVHQIGQGRQLVVKAIAQPDDCMIPAGDGRLERCVHRHRHRTSTGIEQRRRCIQIGGAIAERQAEARRQGEYLGVVRIDELGAALAGLAVGEAVTEHPTTDTLSCLDHDDVGATGDQFLCTSQTGEPAADDHHVAHLRTASVARE